MLPDPDNPRQNVVVTSLPHSFRRAKLQIDQEPAAEHFVGDWEAAGYSGLSSQGFDPHSKFRLPSRRWVICVPPRRSAGSNWRREKIKPRNFDICVGVLHEDLNPSRVHALGGRDNRSISNDISGRRRMLWPASTIRCGLRRNRPGRRFERWSRPAKASSPSLRTRSADVLSVDAEHSRDGTGNARAGLAPARLCCHLNRRSADAVGSARAVGAVHDEAARSSKRTARGQTMSTIKSDIARRVTEGCNRGSCRITIRRGEETTMGWPVGPELQSTWTSDRRWRS